MIPTFQAYLAEWEARKGEIDDNNFFYFSAPLENILSFPSEFPRAQLYETISERVATRFRNITPRGSLPANFAAKSRVVLQYTEDPHNVGELQSTIHNLLSYCVQQNIESVWADSCLDVIARNEQR